MNGYTRYAKWHEKKRKSLVTGQKRSLFQYTREKVIKMSVAAIEV